MDLSFAYDTVNLRKLNSKITKDFKFANMVEMLLSNGRFYVDFQGRHSRWKNQWNELRQGSALAPIIFNIYINEQPITPNTKNFICTDDVTRTAQYDILKKLKNISHKL